MSTPRILAICNGRVFYGQERANLLVLEILKAQGCDVLAVVDDHPLSKVIPAELAKRHIAYVAAPALIQRLNGHFLDYIFGNSFRYLRAKRQLKQVVAEFRPTHIQVAGELAFLIADAIAPPQLPIIYLGADLPVRHNFLWRGIWRRIASRVDRFVTMSSFIAGTLSYLGIPKARCSIIFWPPAARAKAARPSQSIGEFSHILFIGQLSAHKGPDRLIEAFRRIALHYPKARLTLLGRISTWSGDDWQRRLRDRTLADPLLRERVRFPGETEDIFDYLANAAFLVVPSVWEEPFGLIVGEAKAAARPCVVFPSGGLVEQVVHGEDGFICRDCSVESLVEGLRYYLDAPDRVESHGRAALQSLTRLGSDKFAERWRAVYEGTMKGGGGGIARRNSSGVGEQ
jgi:glycosyltransferase involved in cell wall biosynthesis